MDIVTPTGTDFRMLTCIEMTLPGGDEGGVQCSFEQVGITGDCPEDPTIAEVRTRFVERTAHCWGS